MPAIKVRLNRVLQLSTRLFAAALVVFEQCGHVPQVEKSAEFNAAVIKFFSPTKE